MRNKRILVTFGLFSPIHWPPLAPHQSIDRLAYRALKDAGFRETIWQFVYRSQRGGLVLPIDKGRLELHARFYANGTIEAELEVGRRFIGHFLNPRYPAEGRVLELIKPHLTLEQFTAIARRFGSPVSAPPESTPSFATEDISYLGLATMGLVVVTPLAISGIIPLWVLAALFVTTIVLKLTLPKRRTEHA